ncbi:hypothetical protein ACWDZ4_34510, partial [Streptomyces sp. NPDC003016]
PSVTTTRGTARLFLTRRREKCRAAVFVPPVLTGGPLDGLLGLPVRRERAPRCRWGRCAAYW